MSKRKILKGMTLIELVIVMAIFGILLLAVMSIADPVSKIFRNAESSEKTYAYTNNIDVFLQNQLQYVDNIKVITEDKLVGVSNRDLAEDFRSTYYKDIVVKGGLTFTIKRTIDGKYLDSTGAVYEESEKPELTLASFTLDNSTDEYVLSMSGLDNGTYILSETAQNGGSQNSTNYIVTDGTLEIRKAKSAYENFDKVAAKAIEGKIYVLRLANHDGVADEVPVYDNSGSLTGYEPVKKGQIYLYTYNFESDTELSSTSPAPVPQLNDAYFEAGDAKYTLNYVLGAQTLTGITNPISGSKEKFEVIADDLSDEALNAINYKNLTVSIIASKKLDTGEAAVFSQDEFAGYSVFKAAVSVSAANIPLLNISFRASSSDSNSVLMAKRWQKVWVPDSFKDDGSLDKEAHWEIQRQPAVAQAVDAYSVYDTIDATKDIYFVYAYADELTT